MALLLLLLLLSIGVPSLLLHRHRLAHLRHNNNNNWYSKQFKHCENRCPEEVHGQMRIIWMFMQDKKL